MRHLCDSHLHLQDARLDPWRSEVVEALRSLRVIHWGVNGTGPGDWNAVSDLARHHAEVIPSFGLHPWKVKQAPEGWESSLRSVLESHPKAGVGEIGLDKWVAEPTLAVQIPAFLRQLTFANELHRPVTIHCLKAWGTLLRLFREHPDCVPLRGFLLHSFGGPAEMVPALVRLGARFSFSGYFLEPRKEMVCQTFREIPRDRVLVETDAPDMLLPAGLDGYGLLREGRRVNHPGNIERILVGLAGVLECGVDELAGQTLANHESLFGCS